MLRRLESVHSWFIESHSYTGRHLPYGITLPLTSIIQHTAVNPTLSWTVAGQPDPWRCGYNSWSVSLINTDRLTWLRQR